MIALAHFYVGCIDPEVGPVALERAVQKPLDLFVDFFVQA